MRADLCEAKSASRSFTIARSREAERADNRVNARVDCICFSDLRDELSRKCARAEENPPSWRHSAISRSARRESSRQSLAQGARNKGGAGKSRRYFNENYISRFPRLARKTVHPLQPLHSRYMRRRLMRAGYIASDSARARAFPFTSAPRR